MKFVISLNNEIQAGMAGTAGKKVRSCLYFLDAMHGYWMRYAAIIILLTIAVPAYADQWFTGTGDWFTGGNWVDGSVPLTTDDVIINNGGTAQVGAAGAVANRIFLGAGTGTIEVNNGTLDHNQLLIGENGTGTLTISGGGVVSQNVTLLQNIVGDQAGSQGNVTVTGAGSTWNIRQPMNIGNGGTGSLTISNGGAVVSNAGTVIGALSGGQGSVTVTGAGSSWDNSAIQIGGSGIGSLNISNGGSVTSSASIQLGSTSNGQGSATVSDAGSSWSINGALNLGSTTNASGNLTIQDSGTVSVTGLLSLTTSNVTSTAVLNIGNGAGAGILNTATVNGGAGTATINFNHTDANYFFTNDGTNGGAAINITGSTTVNHNNIGTTILNGTNTYTGTTTINNGTLTLQGGAAIADSGAVTVNGGTLEIDTAETIGSLSGSGGIVNLNTGLTVGDATDTTYSGVIQGGNGLTKQGTGNMELTGTNTYSGATTINAGTLSVNGSIASSTTTVNASGTLGGTGTVGTVNVSGGTFAPGNSIGTINVAGNVDFTGGGNYNVEVDAAGNSDLINATGTATLTSGIVNVQPQAGTYAVSTDYTILTAAGGLGGTTFASVNSNLAFLTPTLTYDPNNVFLNLTRNSVSFSSVANTPNQISVANLLGNNITNLQSIINNVLVLTTSGARQAFDSLSGVQHTHSQALTQLLGQQFLQFLIHRSGLNTSFNTGFAFNPMQEPLLAYEGADWPEFAAASGPGSYPTTDSARGWWLQGFGGFGEYDATANASGADYDTKGAAFGIDTNWRDFNVGIAGNYANSNADTFGGDLDIDSYQLAGYTGWQRDDLYINSAIGFGYHATDASRRVVVGATTNTATVDYDTWQVNAAIETGKIFQLDASSALTPYAGIEYSHSRRDGFTETGAGAVNLKVNAEDQDSLRTTLGLRLSHDIETHDDKRITPYVNVAWVREYMDDISRLEGGFSAAPTSTFVIDGPDLDRNRARIGAGLIGQLNENTTLHLAYHGEVTGSDDHHGFYASVRFTW